MRRGRVLVAREDTSQYKLLDKNSLYNNRIDRDLVVNKPHVITLNLVCIGSTNEIIAKVGYAKTLVKEHCKSRESQ